MDPAVYTRRASCALAHGPATPDLRPAGGGPLQPATGLIGEHTACCAAPSRCQRSGLPSEVLLHGGVVSRRADAAVEPLRLLEVAAYALDSGVQVIDVSLW
jgi:hypothetical protein